MDFTCEEGWTFIHTLFAEHVSQFMVIQLVSLLFYFIFIMV